MLHRYAKDSNTLQDQGSMVIKFIVTGWFLSHKNKLALHLAKSTPYLDIATGDPN